MRGFHVVDDVNDQAIQWVMRHADGLSAHEADDLADWLAADPAHAAAFQVARSSWAVFDDAALEPEIVPLRTQALSAWQQANARRWQPRRGRLGWLLAAASVVLAPCAALLVWLQPDSLVTAAGERRVVTLADGSRVTLDGNTRLEVRLTAQARELRLLQGRALFAVTKDPLRPFSVASAHSIVVAKGTEFSVERATGQTRVVLYEGQVEVLRDQPDQGPRKVQSVGAGPAQSPAHQALKPGRELVVPDGPAVATVDQVPNVDDQRLWESGRLSMSHEPLGLAAERMNRFATGRQLVVMPDAADIPVSGVFNAGDVESFVAGVSHVFAVEATTRGNTIVLKRKKSFIKPT